MLLELIQSIPFSFAALFPVVNPIGSSVIFLSVVKNASPQEIRQLALTITIYTAIMLVTVLCLGSWILRIFGITIPVVLIAGGLVLAFIGWQLLNEPAAAVKEGEGIEQTAQVESLAFFPLTMPITAGPGCIAVAIALGAHSMSHAWEITIWNLIGSAIGIALVSLTVFFCYRYTYIITSKLGKPGTQVIMRLAAFINLCIGLQLMMHGFQQLIMPR